MVQQPVHIVHRYPADFFNHIVKCIMSSQHQLVFTDPVHPAARAFQTEDQAALELLFPFSQLILTDALYSQLLHHFLDQLCNFLRLFGRSSRIHGKQAAVHLGAVVRINRIGKSALLADLLEQA